ncbi:uncharacterized protein TRIADDRAFT_58394 [Trichoplax adhaerens]|uniref:Mediator of RNA polymerase II transcription subunit 30 n=1 Tax=Trichoplax adhaerens TaxID=10228 RepID=B3S1Z6_TRIAD|nr:hypothetical protein TRIADDRAFT_58394 [Trichoplax adhaerens]EDV23277.1 hypothetical protein TRIADDRAFT_58394 [Trichoplax adhaerens]|eukprot:XP_002114187.1 hypothetical protein TRIADDRAFT_58394 [Trichoplax adhaerens]
MAATEGCRIVKRICDESFNLFKWLHEADIGVYKESQYHLEQTETLKQKLDSIKALFRSLRLVYEDCNRNGKIDDQEIKELLFSDNNEAKSTQRDSDKDGLTMERQELEERIKEKNQQLKIVIDQLRETTNNSNSNMFIFHTSTCNVIILSHSDFLCSKSCND